MPDENTDVGRVLRAWTKALGTHDPSNVQRRLLWDGISVEDAIDYLESPSTNTTSDTFEAIQGWLRSSARIDESDQPSEGSQATFVELWRRIASAGMGKLAANLLGEVAAYFQTEHDVWGEYRDVYGDLNDDLVTKLAVVGEPAVWEEFNMRRTPSQIVMAHLGDESPRRTIYCGLLEELRRDGLQSLTEKYPVLRRHLATTLDHWLQSCAELLTRIYRDRHVLLETFDLPIDAKLTAIKQNLGDSHRGGRTVALLTFTSASSLAGPRSIVYKPKDLRIDREFQDALSGLPLPTTSDSPLRGITVLVRAEYGYTEWIPHRVCANDQELRAFYRNAGRLTSILYLFGCTDCHHENLVACGDQLLLVDAETLFEGIPRDHSPDPRPARLQTDLYRRFGNSVIRLGLLPEWYFAAEQRVPRDVSALGIQPPTRLHQQAAGWIELNTDGMISGRIERSARLPTSLPVGIGSPNRLGDFAEEFCDGFSAQLNRIYEEKEEWLRDDGPLARFHKLRRRFIPRPTWLYLWILKQQIEPAALSSEVDQRLVLENLARSYLLSPTKPTNWPLFAAEVAQMDNLDVPFFEQSVDDRELRISDGSAIADYFEISGEENARQKIQQLDDTAIDFQVRLIQGIIAARSMHVDHAARPDSTSTDVFLAELSDGDRFDEAETVGKLLVGTSIADDNGGVEWLGIDAAQDVERSRYGPLGSSLYAGRSGIALFLAALAQGNSANALAYRRTALGACSDLPYLWGVDGADDGYRWWRDQPLGLAGSGGILLALVHLKELLPDSSDAVMHVLSSLLDSLDADFLRSDRQLDMMLGCAGLIGPLLRIGSPRALLLAQEAGDNLVGRQHFGGGWVISTISAAPLTGFSHGAAGMAAALARLHSLTGHGDYLEAAAGALRYERDHFDLDEQNWPDFRGHYDPETPRFMLSWCHGAPGIALSRLCLRNTSLWDAFTREELDYALRSTANQGFAGDSICCGRFGRAAILRLAAEDGKEAKWLDAAVQLERKGVSARRAHGGYSFLDRLGLFTGAAGVGLALLDSTSSRNYHLLPSILSAGLYESSQQN